jgi:8-oxo-dGTP pyrophosphatase MutT (NUDIX family)
MVKAFGIVPYLYFNNDFLIYVYKNKEGKYLFFKGKQEINETKEQTAVREFFEETGYKVDSNYLEKYFESKTKNKLIGLYLVNSNNISFHLKNEKSKKIEDIYEYVWVPCDINLKDNFVKNQQNLFCLIYNELQKEKYKLINKFFKD